MICDLWRSEVCLDDAGHRHTDSRQAGAPDVLEGVDQLQQDGVGDVVTDQGAVLERLQAQAGVLTVVQRLSSQGVGGAHPALSVHLGAAEADVDPGGRHDVRLHLGLGVFPSRHLQWGHRLPAGLTRG